MTEPSTLEWEKILGLLSHKDGKYVEQGLMLMESINLEFADICQHFSLDSNGLCFYDIYDAVVQKWQFHHKSIVIQWLCDQAKLAEYPWALDLDKYLRGRWQTESKWPEPSPLQKITIIGNPSFIPEDYIRNLLKIRQSDDGSTWLITKDYQICAISNSHLQQICQSFPSNPVIQLYKNDSLQNIQEINAINYNQSLTHQHMAATTSNRELLETFLQQTPYYWVREAAASNALLSADDLQKLMTDADRYLLKGIAKNPNASDKVQSQIATLLADEEQYPKLQNTYRFVSDKTLFGAVGYMGLKELAAYCLRTRDSNDDFCSDLRFPEGKGPADLNRYEHSISTIHRIFWNDVQLSNSLLDGALEESEIQAYPLQNLPEGTLYLTSRVSSDCGEPDEVQDGAAYIEINIEYPLNPQELKAMVFDNLHGSTHGTPNSWSGFQYLGQNYYCESGYPDFQGGYSTALSIFLNGKWEALPAVIGSGWYYTFLTNNCEVFLKDKFRERHSEMEEWLKEKHAKLQKAIYSIHDIDFPENYSIFTEST